MFADLLKRVSGNNRSQGTSKGTAETFDTESAPSLTRPLARASLDENDRLRIEINLGADASTESIQSAKDQLRSSLESLLGSFKTAKSLSDDDIQDLVATDTKGNLEILKSSCGGESWKFGTIYGGRNLEFNVTASCEQGGSFAPASYLASAIEEGRKVPLDSYDAKRLVELIRVAKGLSDALDTVDDQVDQCIAEAKTALQGRTAESAVNHHVREATEYLLRNASSE